MNSSASTPIKSYDLFISDLFDNNLFVIDNYQRHYVWTNTQVNDFLGDIESLIDRRKENQGSIHYFGQVIYREKETDRRRKILCEVIDGQQRITTFLLYAAAIQGILNDIKASSFQAIQAASIESLINKCENYLFSEIPGAKKKPKLTLSSKDNDYYQSVLCQLQDGSSNIEKPQDHAPESHKKIFAAQKLIRSYLKNKRKETKNINDYILFLGDSLDAVSTGFQVTTIVPEDDRSTYQLYRVVNYRGEPLRVGELLKAHSAEFLSDSKYYQWAINIWDEILSDSGTDTDRYLKACYTSVTGKSAPTVKFLDHFLKDYFEVDVPIKPLKNKEKENTQTSYFQKLQGLQADYSLCKKLYEGNWPYDGDPDSKVKKWQKDILENLIVRSRHTLCIPVLISAFHQAGYGSGRSKMTSEQNFAKCLELCENTFLTVIVVCSWREVKFKSIYLDACRKMRTEVNYHWKEFRNDLNAISYNDVKKLCKNNISSLTYKPKGQNTDLKHLLIIYDRYIGCFENGVLNDKKVSDGFTLVNNELSVEHIYAESLASTEQDPQLEPKKHTMGNLVIYGCVANTILCDKPYDQKVVSYKNSNYSAARYVGNNYAHWTVNEYNDFRNKICSELEAILLRFYQK